MNSAQANPPNSADFDFSTYAGRLRWALERGGLSQSALARQIGTSPQAISHLCDARTAAAGSVHTPRIAVALAVDVNWLADGTGSATPQQPSSSIKGTLVPVIGELRNDGAGVEEHYFSEVRTALRAAIWDWGAYAMRVRGEALYPRYRANEFVIVCPNAGLLVGHDALVLTDSGHVELKQVIWTNAEEMQLLPVLPSSTLPPAPETLSTKLVIGVLSIWGSVGQQASTEISAYPLTRPPRISA